MSQIRFSVLMPVYNRERYLEQAVNSVLAQTFRNFELIVIDDGSTDRSLQILKSYGDKLQLLQQPNRGPEIARNRAANLAQGEYLAFLDSDDYLLPFALQTYDRLIRHFDSPPLILAKMHISRMGQESSPDQSVADVVDVYKHRDFLSKNHPVGISSSAIVVRKSVFDSIGGLRKDSTPQTFYCDDTHLLLKLGAHSPCVIVRNPPTVVYRHHEGNSVRNLKAMSDAIVRLAASERRGEYPAGPRAKAFIGGRASSFAFTRCFRVGEYAVAAALVARTAPLIVRAVWSLFRRRVQPPPNPLPVP